MPGKLEPGNPNYELAYSTDGIAGYIAALGEQQGVTGSRREKLAAGYSAMTRHEDQLTDRLMSWLRGRNDCRVIGEQQAPGSAWVPTTAFTFRNVDSAAASRAMEKHGIAIRFGDFHSRRLIESLGEI